MRYNRVVLMTKTRFKRMNPSIRLLNDKNRFIFYFDYGVPSSYKINGFF